MNFAYSGNTSEERTTSLQCGQNDSSQRVRYLEVRISLSVYVVISGLLTCVSVTTQSPVLNTNCSINWFSKSRLLEDTDRYLRRNAAKNETATERIQCSPQEVKYARNHIHTEVFWINLYIHKEPYPKTVWRNVRTCIYLLKEISDEAKCFILHHLMHETSGALAQLKH